MNMNYGFEMKYDFQRSWLWLHLYDSKLNWNYWNVFLRTVLAVNIDMLSYELEYLCCHMAM